MADEAASKTVVAFTDQIKAMLSWSQEVKRDERDRVVENIPNVKIVLKMDSRWKGVFRYNEMQRRVYVHRETPWDEGGAKLAEPKPLDDMILGRTQAWLQKQGCMWTVSKETVWTAIMQNAAENSYHPIREYLTKLEWDGVERVPTWLPTYCGTADTPYTRAIGTMVLIGLIQRMMEPGSKMDYMLILEGEQGIQKSKIPGILAGKDYYGVPPASKDLGSVDVSIFLKNKWVVEFGELHALRKADINELKLWLTKEVEDYRPKYGRENVIEPRQCIFIGTSNNSDYLNDSTGARRFWPVHCKFVKVEDLTRDRDQILAEAMVRYKRGEPCYPERSFEAEHFVPEQLARRSRDPWEDTLVPALKNMSKIKTDKIYQILRLDISRVDRLSQTRVKDIMVVLGYTYKHTKTERFWQRHDHVVVEPVKDTELEELTKAAVESERAEDEKPG